MGNNITSLLHDIKPHTFCTKRNKVKGKLLREGISTSTP